MYKEFYIKHPDGDFVLSSEPAGLTINTPLSKKTSAKLLFSRSSGAMDVCMTSSADVYVLTQTRTGGIIKIVRSKGVWHKYDILIPKQGRFYEKGFAAISIYDDVYGFFSIRHNGITSLCMMDISGKQKTPVVISHLKNIDSFCAEATPSDEIFVAFENSDGILCSTLLNNKLAKKREYHILDGGSFSNLKAVTSNEGIFIIFKRNDNVFCIETDHNLTKTRTIYDIGKCNEDDVVSARISGNVFSIDIASESEYYRIDLNIKSGARQIKRSAHTNRKPYEIKTVNSNSSTAEIIV